jgi:non-homologous end joining protein Ku
LIKAKLEDGPIKPREVITPPPVIDLMAALKRSLAPDTPAISGTTAKESEPSPKPRSLRGHRTPLVA